MMHVRFWVKMHDDLGIEGLKHSPNCKDWTPEKRFDLVSRVLAGNHITSISREAHIDSGQLYQWVRRYNERGMDGLRCKKGRPSKGFAMKKKAQKPKSSVSEQEEIRLLSERYKYLKKENEYLKKSTPWSQREKPRKPRRKNKNNH